MYRRFFFYRLRTNGTRLCQILERQIPCAGLESHRNIDVTKSKGELRLGAINHASITPFPASVSA